MLKNGNKLCKYVIILLILAVTTTICGCGDNSIEYRVPAETAQEIEDLKTKNNTLLTDLQQATTKNDEQAAIISDAVLKINNLNSDLLISQSNLTDLKQQYDDLLYNIISLTTAYSAFNYDYTDMNSITITSIYINKNNPVAEKYAVVDKAEITLTNLVFADNTSFYSGLAPGVDNPLQIYCKTADCSGDKSINTIITIKNRTFSETSGYPADSYIKFRYKQ